MTAQPQTNRQPTIYIVIPVHNRKKISLQCLEILFGKGRAKKYQTHVTVVDDGSTDGTSEAIKKHYPLVNILKGDGNLWWTGAMDLAVKHLSNTWQDDDFLFMLNDDVMLREGVIDRLVDLSLKYDNALVTCRARMDNGDYTANATIYHWKFYRLCQNAEDVEEKAERETGLYDVDCVFGRAAAIPVKALKKIDGFRPKIFPHYGGDTDLSLRAKNAGFQVLYDTNTTVDAPVDETTTGTHHLSEKAPSIKQSFSVLFSKRSSFNLINGVLFGIYLAPQGRKLVIVASRIRTSLRRFKTTLGRAVRAKFAR